MDTKQQNEPKATRVEPSADLEPVPRRVETHQPHKKKQRTAPLDGWRCDLCGEIVTAQERPLAPPEKCPRCSSSNMTSMEVWAARRSPLGLWTR
jgi:rubrerythrin